MYQQGGLEQVCHDHQGKRQGSGDEVISSYTTGREIIVKKKTGTHERPRRFGLHSCLWFYRNLHDFLL